MAGPNYKFVHQRVFTAEVAMCIPRSISYTKYERLAYGQTNRKLLPPVLNEVST